ncbi:hypothetical protein SNE40_013244 [Patella caerulea]|uniref:Uncharacterized protein n=1 Tax=Patella caerulea TaxID=87958 RepID=A0AAN8PWT3_PATCE
MTVGCFHQLKELRLDDRDSFFDVLRITQPVFDKFLEPITPFIKKDNNYMEALEPGVKLASTLTVLSGNRIFLYHYVIRLPGSLLVKEVCDAFVMELEGKDTWKESAEEFMHACPVCLWFRGWKTYNHRKVSQDWYEPQRFLLKSVNGIGGCRLQTEHNP